MESGIREPDLISDLPQSILESILVRLPIRDAVQTSLLSRKWRYRWASITRLAFDDECVEKTSSDRSLVEGKLVRFITRALFLHEGPIHTFSLTSTYLQSCPDLDQWILFLSRRDVKQLVLRLGEEEWLRVPSCLFNFSKLNHLELFRCELEFPPGFKGFMFLRSLVLHQVLIQTESIECLISSCPLLENLALSYFDSLALTIRAPLLKCLHLEGEFKDIFLDNAPLLIELSVVMYMTEDIAEHFEHSVNCNFSKFLGHVPCLEKLTGRAYFTKYLSIGNDPRALPITYHRLNMIELCEVSFEDLTEILVVLRLLCSSPNLRELRISGSSSTVAGEVEEPDLGFWTSGCPYECSLAQLTIVKLTEMSSIPHEMEFIKFLLRSSPALETLSITPYSYAKDGRMDMLIELLKFRRVSPQAQILFFQD
ncbi:hypothetical protein MLD38_005380 [Melastoma candidum]|uniref:Uncharacterized protein n=1 Tax=Melastoma candidum TaxID=119954 RepID=A0ACB9SDI9_9MYRT|nr:hypothetical protein MLD38_005380 [Melastoma candidum]